MRQAIVVGKMTMNIETISQASLKPRIEDESVNKSTFSERRGGSQSGTLLCLWQIVSKNRN